MSCVMDTYSNDDRASMIGQLHHVVGRMDRCDRVAKLFGLVSRLQSALAEGADLKAPLGALAVAVDRGLNDDPWTQLHRLVQQLTDHVDSLDTELADGVVAVQTCSVAANDRGKGDPVNEDVLKGKWRQLKGEVKSQWGKLTDDDIDQAEGDAEKLIGRVQERYGYAREDAKREVDDFFRRQPNRL